MFKFKSCEIYFWSVEGNGSCCTGAKHFLVATLQFLGPVVFAGHFAESWMPLPNGYHAQPGEPYDSDVETSLCFSYRHVLS